MFIFALHTFLSPSDGIVDYKWSKQIDIMGSPNELHFDKNIYIWLDLFHLNRYFRDVFSKYFDWVSQISIGMELVYPFTYVSVNNTFFPLYLFVSLNAALANFIRLTINILISYFYTSSFSWTLLSSEIVFSFLPSWASIFNGTNMPCKPAPERGIEKCFICALNGLINVTVSAQSSQMRCRAFYPLCCGVFFFGIKYFVASNIYGKFSLLLNFIIGFDLHINSLLISLQSFSHSTAQHFSRRTILFSPDFYLVFLYTFAKAIDVTTAVCCAMSYRK